MDESKPSSDLEQVTPPSDAVVTERPYTVGKPGETLSRMTPQHEEGETVQAWDRERRAFFYLNGVRERVYLETDPERFDAEGRMLPAE